MHTDWNTVIDEFNEVALENEVIAFGYDVTKLIKVIFEEDFSSFVAVVGKASDKGAAEFSHTPGIFVDLCKAC